MASRRESAPSSASYRLIFSRQHRPNHVQFAALADVTQWADLCTIEECCDAILFADRLFTAAGQIGKG
jgi:hypothetical protein